MRRERRILGTSNERVHWGWVGPASQALRPDADVVDIAREAESG
jgi:hypothetical protein